MTGDIQTRQLEYLLALSREQHFARAAAACGVSQPALSTAIRKLELALGVTIVRRRQRFAGLTPEGQHLVGWAQHLLSEEVHLRDDLSRMRQGLPATLRIGVILAAAPVAPLLTSSFSSIHKLARIRVEVLPCRAIIRKLANFELDAGLIYLTSCPPAHTRSISLYQERYLLLAAEGEYGHRDAVTWSEAATQPICALTADEENRDVLEAVLAPAGSSRRGPVLRADSIGAVYAHVATGRWSGIVAHTWLHGLGLPPSTRAIALAEPSPHPTVALMTVDRVPPSAEASDLVEAMADLDVSGALDQSVAQLTSSSNAPEPSHTHQRPYPSRVRYETD
ncbi:LysR family transcriptional regulator [Pseudonocardia spinosispora]|uniref:LysR family transcriptional regulator n=1 Tax=Pseudonocardia spinosispora TaxID=103441 RepID=UPI00042989B7